MSDFKPTPNLVLFFACEDAAVNVSRTDDDLQFGWWEVKKPLYHVFMPPGVTKGFGTPELCVYYQLSSGSGDYSMLVELHQIDLAVPEKSKRWAWSNLFTIHCPNELAVVEDVVVLRRVSFPTPGLYQLRMKVDGKDVPGGESDLRVFPGA